MSCFMWKYACGSYTDKEDQDQPAHMCRLILAFLVCLQNHYLHICPGWSWPSLSVYKIITCTYVQADLGLPFLLTKSLPAHMCRLILAFLVCLQNHYLHICPGWSWPSLSVYKIITCTYVQANLGLPFLLTKSLPAHMSRLILAFLVFLQNHYLHICPGWSLPCLLTESLPAHMCRLIFALSAYRIITCTYVQADLGFLCLLSELLPTHMCRLILTFLVCLQNHYLHICAGWSLPCLLTESLPAHMCRLIFALSAYRIITCSYVQADLCLVCLQNHYLHICAGWSWPSLSAYRIIRYCMIDQYIAETIIR